MVYNTHSSQSKSTNHRLHMLLYTSRYSVALPTVSVDDARQWYGCVQISMEDISWMNWWLYRRDVLLIFPARRENLLVLSGGECRSNLVCKIHATYFEMWWIHSRMTYCSEVWKHPLSRWTVGEILQAQSLSIHA